MLVRFLALALIGWTLVEITLYVVVYRHKNLPLEMMPLFLRSLPAFVGIIFLIKARALAEWLSNILD